MTAWTLGKKSVLSWVRHDLLLKKIKETGINLPHRKITGCCTGWPTVISGGSILGPLLYIDELYIDEIATHPVGSQCTQTTYQHSRQNSKGSLCVWIANNRLKLNEVLSQGNMCPHCRDSQLTRVDQFKYLGWSEMDINSRLIQG